MGRFVVHQSGKSWCVCWFSVVDGTVTVDLKGKPWSPFDAVIRDWLYSTKPAAELAAVNFNRAIRKGAP